MTSLHSGINLAHYFTCCHTRMSCLKLQYPPFAILSVIGWILDDLNMITVCKHHNNYHQSYGNDFHIIIGLLNIESSMHILWHHNHIRIIKLNIKCTSSANLKLEIPFHITMGPNGFFRTLSHVVTRLNRHIVYSSSLS